MFTHAEARPPFDRVATNGFRCVKYEDQGAVPSELMREVPLLARDYSKESPVSDEIYEAYKSQFSCDRTPLNADTSRLAYFGNSWGARLAPAMLTMDPRFKVAVLMLGGLDTARALPEIDLINFAPRVNVPVLMLNGEHDHIYPLETSQKPLFALLGTPPEHKRHIIYPNVGHDLIGRVRNQVIRESLDWLDRYLGPVN